MMKKIAKVLSLILICAFAFSSSGCISISLLLINRAVKQYYAPLSVDWSGEVGTIHSDISFGQWSDTSYDLYIPTKLNQEKECALILFIHGGSFTAGDKADEDAWCKFFASKGYITATVNYSLMGDGRNSNINLMNEQIYACVEAIKENCSMRGYDIKQMATSGQSAGGCLAMLYAYSHAEDSPIPVKFVFQQTGPASFHIAHWGGTVTQESYAEVVNAVLGWTGEKITEEMVADGSYLSYIDAISPAGCVNENTVPTLCAYGPNDVIVPVDMKFVLFAQFDKYGVTYEFVNFENSGHDMMGDPEKQEYFVKRSLEYCELYFD
ncbi:MAG: alpha/beta hydrolase [Ruminococcaceae bacterium]|nr:alpha/beta hydrolase [Oscillospiraceae bacterium]